MIPTTTETINLNSRFIELKCREPQTFCFLPENIEDAKSIDEFIYSENTLTLRKLFKVNNLPEDRLENTVERYRQRRSIDWYAPTIFIGYTLWTQNPAIVSIGLNVLSSYIVDFFKGSFGEKKVKVEIVIEETPQKTYKKITYEGGVEGLNDIVELVKSLKQ